MRERISPFSCFSNTTIDSTICAPTVARPTYPPELMNRQRDGQNIKTCLNQTPGTSPSFNSDSNNVFVTCNESRKSAGKTLSDSGRITSSKVRTKRSRRFFKYSSYKLVTKPHYTNTVINLSSHALTDKRNSCLKISFFVPLQSTSTT